MTTPLQPVLRRLVRLLLAHDRDAPPRPHQLLPRRVRGEQAFQHVQAVYDGCADPDDEQLSA